MYTVHVSHAAAKSLAKAPHEVKERYDVWLQVVEDLGPQGLRAIKGFHDEKLTGRFAHLRSSRLGAKWRVYYQVFQSTVTVQVEEVDAHKYGK